ncbi:trypsin-like cysteine/serine peptidase domain-containing protein [Hyaloraphidium curvatum]|nr:trypsin-like cysteine/serine peptidase domain-containing protein [Hyaloraphidium curvatum]
MASAAAFALLLATALAVPGHASPLAAPRSLAPRLLGATENVTDLSAYPWVVRFFRESDGQILACTGALIAPTKVLTDFECAIQLDKGRAALYHAVRNATTQAQGGTVFNIASVNPDPNSHLGIVTLGSVVFDGGKPIVTVAWNRAAGVPAAGADVTVLGFGHTQIEPTTVRPQNLQRYTGKIGVYSTCKPRDMVEACLVSECLCVTGARAGACTGDGGALAVVSIGGTPTVVGLFAIPVLGCARDAAFASDSFFARTSYSAAFIQRQIDGPAKTTSKKAAAKKTTSKRKTTTKKTVKKTTTKRKRTTTKRR